jgi:hypothetical protein
MFDSTVYSNRRKALLDKMTASRGLAVFVGNVDAAMNYRGNDYKFRQDSNFMYFWGIDEPAFAAVLDLDNGTECLYGNDVDIDDIVWMGPQPSVASKGELIGCRSTAPLAEFDKVVASAVSAGRPIHFLPPSRYYNTMKLAALTGIPVEAVRKVDRNHIIILGGAQWNSNFQPREGTLFDEGIMYSCHRYGGPATAEAIAGFIEFRDKVQRPMYMGEIGHNTEQWMADFCKAMEDNNIGYTFWPYKKIESSCFVGITPPEGWESVQRFSEAPRGTFSEIREARPSQQESLRLMQEFLENSRFENCNIQKGYIQAIGLKAE